jgi:hypothetical protein
MSVRTLGVDVKKKGWRAYSANYEAYESAYSFEQSDLGLFKTHLIDFRVNLYMMRSPKGPYTLTLQSIKWTSPFGGLRGSLRVWLKN